MRTQQERALAVDPCWPDLRGRHPKSVRTGYERWRATAVEGGFNEFNRDEEGDSVFRSASLFRGLAIPPARGW